MNILIDKTTNKVAGVNSPANPFQISIDVPEDFTLGKTIQEVSEVQPEKQKTNDQGQLLYKGNVIVDAEGNETYDEVTEAKKATEWEERQVTNKWVDEEGVKHSETVTINAPIAWEELEPVMIPNIVNKYVTIKDRPEVFTAEEVLIKKCKGLTGAAGLQHVVADVFLNESDLDLTAPGHSANTGINMVQLLPQGQCVTKEITLAAAADTFTLLEFDAPDGVEIYLNEMLLALNEAVTTAAPTDKVRIKFVNTTDKLKMVRGYVIGH